MNLVRGKREATVNAIEKLASEQGFECMGACKASDLTTREEVRSMCAANTCQTYDRSWACPPACGDVKDFERQMHEFDSCLVVQTVAELEDDFDFETMAEADKLQKERILGLVMAIDALGMSDEITVLSAGTCTLCQECSYPDAPCRFPDKRLVSMEAAGLVVSEVCELASMETEFVPYFRGGDDGIPFRFAKQRLRVRALRPSAYEMPTGHFA